jgi:hypothetical protein
MVRERPESCSVGDEETNPLSLEKARIRPVRRSNRATPSPSLFGAFMMLIQMSAWESSKAVELLRDGSALAR